MGPQQAFVFRPRWAVLCLGLGVAGCALDSTETAPAPEASPRETTPEGRSPGHGPTPIACGGDVTKGCGDVIIATDEDDHWLAMKHLATPHVMMAIDPVYIAADDPELGQLTAREDVRFVVAQSPEVVERWHAQREAEAEAAAPLDVVASAVSPERSRDDFRRSRGLARNPGDAQLATAMAKIANAIVLPYGDTITWRLTSHGFPAVTQDTPGCYVGVLLNPGGVTSVEGPFGHDYTTTAIYTQQDSRWGPVVMPANITVALQWGKYATWTVTSSVTTAEACAMPLPEG